MMLKAMKRRQGWTQHQWIRLVAGSMILLSLGLSLTYGVHTSLKNLETLH